MSASVVCGDSLELMARLDPETFEAVVTDPPYGISFAGNAWDHGLPGRPFWEAALRLLKPGGYLLAFGAPRTAHRLAVAIEDAGFELRDSLLWLYSTGIPKSGNLGRSLDRLDVETLSLAKRFRFTAWFRSLEIPTATVNRLTETAMGGHYIAQNSQPAIPTRELFERLRSVLPPDIPEWVEQLVNERTTESETFKAREVVGKVWRPSWSDDGSGNYADRPISIPASDLAKQWDGWGSSLKPSYEPIILGRKPFSGSLARNVERNGTGALNIGALRLQDENNSGRWPANVLLDPGAASLLDSATDGASRFFYCSKAPAVERSSAFGVRHPTVKPLEIMRHLLRLVTPPGGRVLDPFAGSGSTIVAARQLGFSALGIELNESYAELATERLAKAQPLGSEEMANGSQLSLWGKS